MGEHERILLADDSSDFRDSIKMFLVLCGQNVVAEAASVAEVTAIVDDEKIDFSFAVVDGKMPNYGDGKKAADYIKSRRPEVKVISMSGDLQDWGDVRMSKQKHTAQDVLDAIIKS